MSKLMEIVHEGKPSSWVIFCPGCECGHEFDSRWTFNGNQDKPTFRASMLVYEHKSTPPFKDQPRCHSYVTDGKIEFLPDTQHKLAGKTVELPDFDSLSAEDKEQC